MTIAALAPPVVIFEANRCDCCGHLSDIHGTCFRCLNWASWVYRKVKLLADIRAIQIQEESNGV